MPIEVVLEEAKGVSPCARTGELFYFVLIEGVPYSKGLVVTNAYPLTRAKRIQAAVEASLQKYGRPPPKPKPSKKVRSRFERVRDQSSR